MIGNSAQVLWFVLFVSIVLTARALSGRSWVTMWAAAVCSLAVSILGMLSIGALTFLLTCLQVAAAIAMRRGEPRRGWIAIVLAAVLIWIAVVPTQIALSRSFGWTFLGWIVLFPLAGLLGLLLPVLPIDRHEPQHS